MANESKITDLTTASPKAAAVNSAPRGVVTRKGNDSSLSGVMKTINIFASEQAGGEFAVLVGLNDVMYQIPRGLEVEVPEEVVDVLNNAIYTVTLPGSAGGVVTRAVPRHNFQVLG